MSFVYMFDDILHEYYIFNIYGFAQSLFGSLFLQVSSIFIIMPRSLIIAAMALLAVVGAFKVAMEY